MQFQDIFIDLDNTILDFYATEAEVLGQALAVGGIAPEEDTLALYHHINLRQWQLRHQRGENRPAPQGYRNGQHV